MADIPRSWADIFFGGTPDPGISNNSFSPPDGMKKGSKEFTQWLVANQFLASRSEFLNRFFDKRRNIPDECGYPVNMDSITKENLYDLHCREAIANRVNVVLPKETWQVQPSVYEIEDPERWTPFEESWKDLGRQLKGESSWHKDEPGSVVWEFLRRADILSGMGHFGIILLGLDGDEDLSEPAKMRKPKKPPKKTRPRPGQVEPGSEDEGLDLENLPGEDGEPPLPPPPKRRPPIPNEASPRRSLIYNAPPFPTRRRPASSPTRRAQSDESEEYLSREDEEELSDIERAMEEGGIEEQMELGDDELEEGELKEELALEDSLPVDEDGNPIPEEELSPVEAAKARVEAEAKAKAAEGPIIGPSKPPSRKLLYLRVFPEHLVDIAEYETDPGDARFGQPTYYNVTLHDPRDIKGGGIGLSTATKRVHWTRVIHIADNRESSEVFGVPRTRPVLRRLLDLEKLYAAYPEGYWKSCFMGLALETNPALGGDVKIDIASLRDMMEEYSNGLQRWMALSGLTAKSIAPSVVDPTNYVNTQIEAICIQLAIPKRIFMGSERGELASSQDDAAWNDRLKERQNSYVTPRVIAPFIDRLIALDVLAEPSAYTPAPAPPTDPGEAIQDLDSPASGGKAPPFGAKGNKPSGEKKPFPPPPTGNAASGEDAPGYTIWWPDLTSQTALEKAQVFSAKVSAYAAYLSSQLNTLIPEMDLMTKFDDLTEEEAQAILDNVEALSAQRELESLEEQEKAMAAEEEAIARGVKPDPTDPSQVAPGFGPPNGPGGGSPFPPAGGGNGFPLKEGGKIGKKPPPFMR